MSHACTNMYMIVWLEYQGAIKINTLWNCINFRSHKIITVLNIQVAEFIIKNAGEYQRSSAVQNYDPFTGEIHTLTLYRCIL